MSEAAELAEVQAKGIDIFSGHRPAAPNGGATYDVDGVLLPRPFKITKIGPVRLFVDDVDSADPMTGGCHHRPAPVGRSTGRRGRSQLLPIAHLHNPNQEDRHTAKACPLYAACASKGTLFYARRIVAEKSGGRPGRRQANTRRD